MMPEKPLSGKTVLFTRAREQALPFAEQAEQMGAETAVIPLLAFSPSGNAAEIQKVLEELPDYKWIVFTSANGVKYFFSHFKKSDSIPHHVKVAAVGMKTAKKLQEYSVRTDLLPEEYTAEGLSESMIKELRSGEKVLIIRGSRSREVLTAELKAKGFSVTECMVYNTIVKKEAKLELFETISRKPFDYITLASPSAVDGFMNAVKENSQEEQCKNTHFVCIGPITAEALKEYGLNALVPERYTMEDMLEKMAEHASLTEEEQTWN
ncbi:uroporphyrinogen-III synthase [Metabacillus sp. GX 13764]|uniref:uroporphyrinogen-III synthase n=1 Tax=Metabacillus kandeliae TaxID=2900151 RepID=UPI001E40CE65|nr:uroporphyrinogen-III synthase [Metabacillus kandeliae]MCD7032891.1 uroporphyrinogen-III synthase [Metabacillus kandeliae]